MPDASNQHPASKRPICQLSGRSHFPLPKRQKCRIFEKQAFRSKKKIFATLIEADGLGVALLSPSEQYVFCKMDKENIYPVPNKWGLKGATFLKIKNIPKKILAEIPETVYQLSLQPPPSKK